jgi:hypothetical protein
LLALHRTAATISITLDPDVLPTLRETDTAIAGKKVIYMTFPATGKLTYSIQFRSGR